MLTADFLPKLGSVSRFSVGSAASGKKLADPVAIDRFGRAADGLGSTRRVVALLLLLVPIWADSRESGFLIRGFAAHFRLLYLLWPNADGRVSSAGFLLRGFVASACRSR